MEFGVFYEVSVPEPWDPETTRRTYENCLEQVRIAESLGFDQVWAVEHHFLAHQSHCSSPEIFLTACAMETTTIRVGHGIVVCVPEINNPIRVAERAAFLDHLSGGRLEFGTGRAATWAELSGFGADPDSTKRTWDEYVRTIPKMWMQERFEYSGEAFSMPSRAVLPKPLQQPHPPMWVAVTSPGTELDAAERGLGCLTVSFGSLAETERKIKGYRQRIQQCDPVGGTVNDQVNIVNFLYCHEDHEQATQLGQRFARRYTGVAANYISAMEAVPSGTYATAALLPGLQTEKKTAARRSGKLPEGVTIGDPSHIIAAIKEWEATGADRICFLIDRGDVLSQDQVLASLRLFAKEVMPHFR